MFRVIVYIALCIAYLNIKPILSCQYNPEYEYANCSTLQQLQDIPTNTNWTKVHIVRSGNNVKLDVLKLNSFDNLPHLKEIRIDGLVKDIEPGVFDHLKQLDIVYLDNNKIRVISKDIFGKASLRMIFVNNSRVRDIEPNAFDNLPNLILVSITDNRIPTIKSGVFNNLKIKTLVLSRNKIEFIENNAFAGMDQLDILKIKYNKLTSFDSKRLLGPAPKLTSLSLKYNYIQSLRKDMFDGLPNLTYLSLASNELNKIHPQSFENLNKLYHLDISNNNLNELPANVFPTSGLLSLENLLLHENKLCFLSPDVLSRIPNVNYFSYGGNPWQCPCWEYIDKWIAQNNIVRICDDEYKLGKRPECIINMNAPTECIFDSERVKDIPLLYFNQTSNFQKKTNCLY